MGGLVLKGSPVYTFHTIAPHGPTLAKVVCGGLGFEYYTCSVHGRGVVRRVCVHTKLGTRLGGVAHNGFSMAMVLVTTEEYGDQENGEHFFLDIIETWKSTIVAIFL